MRYSVGIGILAAAIAGLAAPAGAVEDVITFDEVAPGTAIDGVTLLGYATFSTLVEDVASPTVEVEGVPEDGAFGEGAFLIGTVGDIVTIDLAIPVSRVSLDFALNQTAEASTEVRLQVFGADGTLLDFIGGFTGAIDTWPAAEGSAVSGRVVMVSDEEIHSIRVMFPGRPFLTLFALDNIELSTVACSDADIAEPFGSMDFSDVVAFLGAWSAEGGLADLAAPFGTWDFSDVVAFLGAFGAGCP